MVNNSFLILGKILHGGRGGCETPRSHGSTGSIP